LTFFVAFPRLAEVLSVIFKGKVALMTAAIAESPLVRIKVTVKLKIMYSG
jgi:hypothetical protein